MIYSLFGLLFAAGAAAWAADKALIHDALAGRKKAMRVLVQRLLPVIRARVTWRLRGYEKLPFTPEDLTQQVWITLLKDSGQQLRGYDPDRGAALETYVGLIARREVGNAIEKAVAVKRGAGKVTSDDGAILDRVPTGDAEVGAQVAARSELQALLDHLDHELTERQRLVVRLAWVDGYSAPEMARALNTSTQNIYNDQHRIRKVAKAWMAAQASA